ncbi:5677_t:CDS:2 [Entrophospora sp. SA101]|nr:5677_t:CDS:2 [Entrophospora sp. SA101]
MDSGYNNLDLITREFSDCPIMLLSATVSPHDINAICNKIGINDANLCVVWGSNIRRQEIFYTIQQKKSTFINDIIHIISSSNDQFIIYGPTYHSCDEVYEVIQEKLPNIKVGKYHGDVQSDKQEEVLINFKKGILQGVIATPESRRVARDGNPGKSILFFSHSDLGTLFSVIAGGKERQKDNPIQFDVDEDALLMVKIVSILVNEVSESTHTDIGYVYTSANNREVHAKKLSKTSVYNNKSLHPAKYINKQSQALFLLDDLIICGIVTYNIISKLSKTKNFISGKYHLSHNMFINGICEGAEDKGLYS